MDHCLHLPRAPTSAEAFGAGGVVVQGEGSSAERGVGFAVQTRVGRTREDHGSLRLLQRAVLTPCAKVPLPSGLCHASTTGRARCQGRRLPTLHANISSRLRVERRRHCQRDNSAALCVIAHGSIPSFANLAWTGLGLGRVGSFPTTIWIRIALHRRWATAYGSG